MSTQHVGFYSIIQYYNKADLEEAINCGLILVIPSLKYVNIAISEYPTRIYAALDVDLDFRERAKKFQSDLMQQAGLLLEDEKFRFLPVNHYKNFKFGTFKHFDIQEEPSICLTRLYLEHIDSKPESTLTKKIRSLLSEIKEHTFIADRMPINAQTITFQKADKLLALADEIRLLLDD